MRLPLRLLAAASAAVLVPAAAHAAPVPDYAPAPTPYTGGEQVFCTNAAGTTSYKCDAADVSKVVLGSSNTWSAPQTFGGVALTTLPAHSVVVGEGGSVATGAGPGTAGQFLVSGGASADPSFTTLISGAPTAGDCVKWASATQLADSGVACGGAPGASGDLVFNNAGALAGAPDWQHLPAGTLYSALTGGTAAITLNSNGTAYGQIGTVDSTHFGLCYGGLSSLGSCSVEWGSPGVLITGNQLDISMANTTNFYSGATLALQFYPSGSSTGTDLTIESGTLLNFGSGAVGLCYDTYTGGAIIDVGNACGNKAGAMQLGTLIANAAINFPDGGEDTANFLRVGDHVGPGSGMTFEAPIGAVMPTPAVVAYGGGAIGLPAVGSPLGPSNEYIYTGLTIQGWATPTTAGCSPYCQVNDVTFEDHAGNVIAGVQSPVVSAFGHPFPFLVGSTRTVTAAGGDEGMYVSQLLIGDIIPSGTVEGPRILFQPGPSQTSPATGPAFLGIGPESPTNNNFRFGHSGNEVSAWDDDGTYPTDVDVTGCWGAGIGTGSAFEGGVGVTWAAKLCPLSGGGFEIMNAAKSGDAPLKASIYRTVPTTVAGLAATDASPSVGDRAVVTDAASCAFNSAVAGGGSIKCPVVYAGSWVAG
jgi:hypothetical protein